LFRGWHFKIANFGLTQFASKFPTSASGANITESILKSIFDLTETDSPTTLPTGNVEINWDKFDDIVKDQPPTEQGSNAWTVSGKFTNGKPFLASDPHLAQSLPSVWYQNHLIVNSGGKTTLNVTGVTMPGIPFVQIGHNDRIAWGITLSYADVADIFLEKISKDKKTYEFKGEQKPIQEVEEVIFIKGQETPFIETVRLTHHGPIISGLVNYTDSPMEFAISATYLKDTLHVPMEVFFELNQAESVPKAREVLLNMGLLSLNIILADDQDNIGYQMTGEIPIRTQFAINHPNLPYAGWDGKAEWQGYLDIKQNPAAINPEQGYIISCNHRIVGPDYKHYLGNSFKYGSRAIRIKTMLTETLKRNNNRLTLRDFAKWQNDVHEPPSVYQPIVDLIKNNFDELSKFVPLKENITHDHYLRILQELRDFNGEMDKDSIGAGIYTVFVDQLFIRIMVKLGLEEKLWARIKGCGISPALFAVNEYFGHEVHTIEKLSHIPDIITNKDIYHAAVNTVFSLRNLLGLKQAPQDPHEVILTTGLWAHFMKQDRNMSMEEEFNMYKYGNYHQLVLQHAFGQRITEFNRGPYPHGGSPNTPNMGAPYPDGKNYAIKINASFRMLIDLGNVSDAISIFAPGQSGHLASKHYNDFTASFIRGQYNDMYFTSQVIEKNKEGTLTLVKK
jgi:penicillin amidase